MRSKKKLFVILSVLILVNLLVGCGEKKKPNSKGNYVNLYYFDEKEKSLFTREVLLDETKDTKEQMEILVEKLMDVKKDEEYLSIFPKELHVTKVEFEDHAGKIYFSKEFDQLDKTQKLICVGGLVESLVQLKDIEGVYLFVGDSPLLREDGREMGFLQGDDFVQNTGSSLHAYQVTDLVLFFPNSKGDHLREEKRSVRYNTNHQLEKLVVEQVMKGTKEIGNKNALPKEVILLGVTVKDQICYLNFDESFEDGSTDILPDVVIYSLVNSLVYNCNVKKVQISINGETDIKYQGKINLNRLFESDMNLLEKG